MNVGEVVQPGGWTSFRRSVADYLLMGCDQAKALCHSAKNISADCGR